MKKLITIILCAACALALASCTRIGGSIEELLTAPRLSDDQYAVLSALSAVSSDAAIKLKYPAAGDNRAPIHFADLDRDGKREAVVFYSAPSLSVYARIAVLESRESGWEIVSLFEGLGTDINKYYTLDYDDGTGYLYAEWSTTNKAERSSVIYSYGEEQLSPVYTQTLIAQTRYDLNADGLYELLFVYPRTSDGPYMLRCVEYRDGSFVVAAAKTLNSSMLDCLSLTAGRLNSSVRGVFVDENIGGGRQLTEVFGYVDGAFSALDYESRDIAALSRRPLDALRVTELGYASYLYVPAARDDGLYSFYTLREGSSALSYLAFCSVEYGFALSLPPELDGSVTVVPDKETRRFNILLGDGTRIGELKVLYPSEKSLVYVRDGFELVGSSDRCAFYMRFSEGSEYMRYITTNFFIFR